MRFALFCSIALGANTAIASVCKPRQSSDTSVVSVEATTSTSAVPSSPTSTELETTGHTTIATSDIPITTTTEASASVATSVSENETTTETTTLPETTTTAAQSLETFQVIAPGHNFQDEHLIGRKATSQQMGFDLEPTANVPTLTFSTEAETSFAREVEGMYWCIEYGSPYSPGDLRLCDKDNLRNGLWGLLTCEQTDDRGLECSVPAMSCGIDMNNGQIVCNDLGGDYTQFSSLKLLMMNRDGLTLALGSKDHPPSSDWYTAVELEVTPAPTK
ncbi:hypothetical protein FSHL1_006285 [Fusarium sambucinum]